MWDRKLQTVPVLPSDVRRQRMHKLIGSCRWRARRAQKRKYTALKQKKCSFIMQGSAENRVAGSRARVPINRVGGA